MCILKEKSDSWVKLFDVSADGTPRLNTYHSKPSRKRKNTILFLGFISGWFTRSAKCVFWKKNLTIGSYVLTFLAVVSKSRTLIEQQQYWRKHIYLLGFIKTWSTISARCACWKTKLTVGLYVLTFLPMVGQDRLLLKQTRYRKIN